jgi:type IX secretion system substrate protein
MKKIITLLALAFCLNGKGQSEFIGIINPNTGTDNIIDSIPGEEWIDGVSTFDDNNHRFIFHGTDRSGINRLYCINAITGAILSQATFTLNMCDFHYDNSSNTLYALYSATGNVLTLASLDIATAAATTITTFTVSGCGGGNTFFDEANHAYVMQNSGSFYSVNVNTGSITTTPASTVFSEMQFDNTTGTPYGLVQAGSSIYLVKINVSNGTYVTIDTLPSGGYNSLGFSFNETNHIYLYVNGNNLYSINVNTGVISSTLFPVGISMINFEMQYDNSSNILYSLQWGTLPSAAGIEHITNSTELNIYPNPNNGSFVIEPIPSLTLPQGKGTLVQVYDINGKLVLTQTINGKTSIDASSLNEGVYNISIQSNEGVVNKRLVIVR